MKDDTFEKLADSFASSWQARADGDPETLAYLLRKLLAQVFRMGREEQRTQTIEKLKELVP